MASPALRQIAADQPAVSEGECRFGADAMQLLNRLRLAAMGCRSAVRADLFRACAMLSTERSASLDAYTQAFVRCLGGALGRSPRLFRPGSPELSFDESWILRLLLSARSGDDDSFRFLIMSQVEPHARRNVAFLACSISDKSSRV